MGKKWEGRKVMRKGRMTWGEKGRGRPESGKWVMRRRVVGRNNGGSVGGEMVGKEHPEMVWPFLKDGKLGIC